MEWTEDQLRQMMRQEIQGRDAHARFQLVPLQRHTHNNLDSPFTFQPVMTYVGLVGVGSSFDPVTINLLPVGWTLTYQGTGAYTINHNLGTALYAVTATASQSTNQKVVCVAEPFTKSVDFNWFTIAAGGAATDTGFFFALTLIANKSQTLPTYYGTYTTHPPVG